MKPQIPVQKILNDLRAGLGDVPIMEKYQISPNVLTQIKRRLDMGHQIYKTPSVSTSEIKDRRSSPRWEPFYKIDVYDRENPQMRGIIDDLNLKGLRTVGLIAQMDETKKLLVRSGPFKVYETFKFTAQCRWSMINDSGECVAGFQITSISVQDKNELRKLINHLTLVSNVI